jgi:hypothetical protein
MHSFQTQHTFHTVIKNLYASKACKELGKVIAQLIQHQYEIHRVTYKTFFSQSPFWWHCASIFQFNHKGSYWLNFQILVCICSCVHFFETIHILCNVVKQIHCWSFMFLLWGCSILFVLSGFNNTLRFSYCIDTKLKHRKQICTAQTRHTFNYSEKKL